MAAGDACSIYKFKSDVPYTRCLKEVLNYVNRNMGLEVRDKTSSSLCCLH